MWDAARKCIEISCQLADKQGLSGWRKASDWKKRLKRSFRKVQKVQKSGGKNKASRLGFAVGSYLELATTLTQKICEFKSNINQLTYNGLNLCRDKGEENFKKYVSLAVVSYNLHRLGNLIKNQLNARTKKRKLRAA